MKFKMCGSGVNLTCVGHCGVEWFVSLEHKDEAPIAACGTAGAQGY